MLLWPHFVSFCDSLMFCVCYCELCDMTATGVRAHILFFVNANVGTVSLTSHFVESKQLPLKLPLQITTMGSP